LNDVIDNRLPRDIEIQKESEVTQDITTTPPVERMEEAAVPIEDNEKTIDFIPFEEFQKTLEN
jgi:hypothetical protein